MLRSLAKRLPLNNVSLPRFKFPNDHELKRLRTENSRYKSQLDSAPTGHFTLDSKFYIVESNHSGAGLLNSLPATLYRTAFLDCVIASDRQRVSTKLSAVTQCGCTNITTALVSDNQIVPVSLHVTPAEMSADDDFTCHIAVEDLSKHKETEDSLRIARTGLQHIAHHDPLTRLPNRCGFTRQLQQALKNTGDRKVALVLLDLDDFKQVNDPLGHQIGDNILREISDRLLSCMRKTDVLCRLGGDEFAIILRSISAECEVSAIVEKIREKLTHKYLCTTYDIRISATIGISCFPDDATSARELFSNADAAMNQAKSFGKNSVQYYSSDLNAMLTERFVLERDLRVALHESQFELYFQPQYDLASNRISGYEVLLRWNHPHLGIVGPDAFIDCAEETGLIEPLGEWILRESCKRLVELRVSDENIRLSVNVSARQFNKGDLHQKISRILSINGVPANALELELTESALLENGDHSIEMLRDLSAAGVELAIDDFGTGYSSFSRLQQLPVSRVKIDRCFVQDIPNNKGNCAIARAIISVAHDLGIAVVAEGVETHEQVVFLSEAGCDILQGYYIGRPAPFERIHQRPSQDKLITLEAELEAAV